MNKYIKATAELKQMQKDIQECVKHVFTLVPGSSINSYSKHPGDVNVLKKYFNQESYDCDDIFFEIYVDKDVQNVLKIFKKYGLTDKNYHIRELPDMYINDKLVEHQGVIVHFPWNDINAKLEMFWRALEWEINANIAKNRAKYFYKEFEKR